VSDAVERDFWARGGCDTDSLFERFTEAAREAIIRAQDEAREMGHGSVRVEHLLVGLFSDNDGIAGRGLANFGLTIAPVRDLVRQRLGVGSTSAPGSQLPFAPEAKGALRSAHLVGLGEPGTEHMLVVIVGRGEGGACEILRALGADPHRIRFETKKRAWPSSVGAGSRGQLRVTSRPWPGELDFGD
jgi:ATP-dependent Clp protease ATP-binding subunit ClpC